MPADDFRAAAHKAADLAADHLADVSRTDHPDLAERPVWQPTPEAVRALLRDAPLPAAGRALDDLLADIAATMLPYAMGNGSPRFSGWVNAAPQPAGVAVSALAAAMNPSSAGGDHADVHLERGVVRWIAELVGFPHRPAGGLLASGASAATIIALAAARQHALTRAGWDVRERGLAGGPRLVGYGTAETHSCVRKAVELLGIGAANLRAVAADAGGHMDAAALHDAIAADRAAGAVPFVVVGSAGTVNTGAVDPLDALADVCAGAGVWFHVDGAYGAFGAVDPAVAHRYRGMERADSLALDPHKWLGVPVDSGCLLVRDPAALRAAFSLIPPYLRDDANADLGWFSEYGFEQTRPFRALRAWAVIAHRGRDGIAADVAHTTALARRLGEWVAAAPDLELAAPVETSIVAFRYAPAGASAPAVDALNERLPVAIQRRGRVFVTGSAFAGRPVLRPCLINPATTETDLRLLLDEVRAAGAEGLAVTRT